MSGAGNCGPFETRDPLMGLNDKAHQDLGDPWRAPLGQMKLPPCKSTSPPKKKT